MGNDNDSSKISSYDELDALRNTETSLLRLAKTLLSRKTMPHIVMISLISMILYIFASNDSLTTITSFMFIGLSGGYTVTAIGSRYENIKKWIVADDEINESSDGNTIKFLKKFKICLFPLSVSVVFSILLILLFGKNGLIPQLYDFVPLFLASLFIFWSIIQGLSFSSWASSISAKKSSDSGKTGNLKRSTIINGFFIISFSILLVGIFQFLKDPSSNLADVLIGNGLYIIAVIASYVLISAWTWNIRIPSSTNPSLNSFSNRWSLICHLFLTWHILTIWRQNFMSPNSIEVLLEELVLMVFTVFMAIWTLTSKGYNNSFKLLNEENSLSWGLAFGYAYAGSVAMLTNVFNEITTVMLLGHCVVILTVIYAYRKVLIKVVSNHDDEIEVRRLVSKSLVEVEVELEDESDAEELENTDDQDENWQEDHDVDWDKKIEDNTISVDVEWEDSIEID